MKDIAIYAWCFFLVSLTFGLWTFLLIAVAVVVILLIIKYRPELFRS